MNSVIATPKRRNVMGNLHYDYECKKTLTSLGKRINIDEEWVDSVMKDTTISCTGLSV